MSSAQELKRRIRTVITTEQVASAMRTSAMSKYTRTHKKSQDFQTYLAECRRLLRLVGSDDSAPDDGCRRRRVCYVAITANRGLCGDYNEALFRFLQQTLASEQEEACLILCGKWGAERAASHGLENVIDVLPVDSVPAYAQAKALYLRVLALWTRGEVDRVVFVYQRFQNILTQVPVCEQLFPAAPAEETAAVPDVIFVPGRAEMLPRLREQCLAAQVYGILLSAAEGAHGAMLMAMRAAADNCAEMRAALELELNRMRQAAVTAEVLELSGGAAANQNEGI